MTTTPDIHDMVTQLTRTHRHNETYVLTRGNETWSARHTTTVPSLVHQLLGATPAGSRDEAGPGGAKSKPAARIEAIDTLMLIDDEAARWVRRLGEDDPGDRLDNHGKVIPGSGTIACITLVHALHPGQTWCGRSAAHRTDAGRPDCCPQHQIEHDVRRWWHQARIVSGWDSPAWRPDNTCPVCEQRQALRVSLVNQTAVCVECRTVWGSDEIGLLAEHIRAENAETDDSEEIAS